jgi:hypothetical protein
MEFGGKSEDIDADTPTGRSGPKLAVGNELWSIRDAGGPIEYVDLITELRTHNSVVYLSLGSAVIDAGNVPIAAIVSRLRMDMGTARNLHNLLGQVIADALKPSDKLQAN